MSDKFDSSYENKIQFEKSCKSICDGLIVLSDILLRQEFRACFFEHVSSEIVKLIQNRSLGSVCDVNDLRNLQQELVKPLISHLRASTNSTEKCLLIKCLMNTLKLTPIDDVSLFFLLYLLLFSQVFDEKTLVHHVSEELKIVVLECSSCLIENSTQKVLEEVFRKDSGQKLSTGIFTSVGHARNERSLQLRLKALSFLLTVSQFEENCTYDKVIHKNLGDLFMLYLPGVVAPLQEIISSKGPQHHPIIEKALKCWGHILCLVMCDFPRDERQTEIEIMKSWIVSNENSIYRNEVMDVRTILKEKERTKDWVKAAGKTLKPLIVAVAEATNYSCEKCRLEITRVMIKLLENCSVNLRDSLTPIMDVIVGSSVDENEELCQAAEEMLEKFERFDEKRWGKSFATVIETNLDTLLIKLPGIIHSGNEKFILASLKTLSGYLRNLKKLDKLRSLFYLPILKKLVFVIRIGFKLGTHPEISISDEIVCSKRRWKKFEHFEEESIEVELERICRILGEGGEPETIFDYLIDVYREEKARGNETILILNQVVLGTNEIEDHLVNELLEFYLDSDKLHPVLDASEDDGTNLNQARSNIIQVALIMEGVGNLATRLGKRFQDRLLETLYCTVECMGSAYAPIRAEATKTATAMSEACGFEGNVELLIRNNLDYLSYHSAVKLKRNASGALEAVTVLIENSTIETIPTLEDIIENVLKTSSRNFDSPLTASYLKLFRTFVSRVKKCLEASHGGIKSASTESKRQVSDESPAIRFLRFLRDKEKEEEERGKEGEGEEENFLDSEDVVEESEKEMEPTPEAPPPPKHVAMTLALAGHSLHFLASKDNNKKLIVLEILDESVSILSEWENQLLPLVHKIWSPLVTRFDSFGADPLLIRASFNLLCTLARASRHFIRSRTLENVLPTLLSFLTREASNSTLETSPTGYCFTQNFKLQRDLLENLAVLIVDLELFEKQTDSIVESVIPYLSANQPEQLQEKCRHFFVRLKSHDPYLIWFKLCGLIESGEFAKNVGAILDSSDLAVELQHDPT